MCVEDHRGWFPESVEEIQTCTYAHNVYIKNINMCICVYTYINLFVYVCVYKCIYIYIYIYVCVGI